MEILYELERLHNQISEARSELDKLEQLRIKWCRDNSAEIKKLFPSKYKFYQIIEKPKEYAFRDLEDSVYYFKPTILRFDPSQQFEHSWRDQIYPTVKGDVYDVNYRKLGVSDVEIYITNLKEIEYNPGSRTQPTCIYVMIDKNTGYYKIGRSRNPKVRERTLQSEKPTIEMIFSKEALVLDERVIHEMFQEKRVRGEWFDLNGSDLQKIREYLKCA